MSKRVLLAGLFHETHTFLDGSTKFEDFTVRRGQELVVTRGDGSPLAGVVEVADESGWELVPTIDARATPSATVEDAAFESFWSELKPVASTELSNGRINGICLVLHGAMACQTIRDVEGELVRRLRELPGGADVPICGVLDLHGNISPEFVEATDGFVAYRCNPHTDAHQASVDGAKLLDRIMTSGQRSTFVFGRPDVIWPPTGTGTDDDPMRTLERMGREIEANDPDIAHINVFGGFAFADTVDTGVSFGAITFGDPDVARAKLRTLTDWVARHPADGFVTDMPLESALPFVLNDIASGTIPVVVVEPSDNIGGGAPGDGTSILRAFINHDLQNAAVVINDAICARKLHDSEDGETVHVSLGGTGSRLTDGPIELDVELLSTSDGRFQLEDRHSHLASMMGVNIDMGLSAVVRYRGIRILVTSRKTPPFDLGQLRSQGITPEACSAIGVKAAVAHRRGYNPITASTYTVDTPGPCSSNLQRFQFKFAKGRRNPERSPEA